VAQYDRELPFIKQLAALCEEAVTERGYLTLYDGARRHWFFGANGLPREDQCYREEATRRKNDPSHAWYKRAVFPVDKYQALNALIQGSAARHTKLWMRACWRECIVPLLQMHDALECSVATREQAERVAQRNSHRRPW
jgi:hypothetical protein